MRSLRLLILFLLIAQITNAQLTYQQVWVDYDSAWTFQNLQIIPIRFKGQGNVAFYRQLLPNQYITLAEGMRTGKVKVKEFVTKGDADVHILSVQNNSDKTILINSGELLGGGKQDRVVGETKLIQPGKEEQYVTVFCVEEGRWSKKVLPFSHSGNIDMELRKTMDLTQRQADIWKEISQSLSAQNIKSISSQYLELDRDIVKADSAYRNFFNAKLAKTDSAFAGFLAITGDRILGTEIFVTPTLFKNAWESMLATFTRSAITKGSNPYIDKKKMELFMDALLENETSQKKTLAQIGKAYKFENLVIGLIAYGF
jgi:L-rhamnose mutarotase